MHIYYFTVQTVKRRTKLVDPKAQQVPGVSRHGCFAWGLGTGCLGCDERQSSWKPAPGTILLALHCWTLQALPSRSLTRLVLVGGLQALEIQLCQRNPCPSAPFNLHYLPRERGAGRDPAIQHSTAHFIHSALPVSWHYEFVVNAEYVMQKYQQWRFFFFLTSFLGKFRAALFFARSLPILLLSHLQGWLKQ